MAVPSDNLRFLRKLPKVRFDEESRGYSKAQVDRVLENIAPIADAIEELQRRLGDAEARAASAEGRIVSAEAKLAETESEMTRLASQPAPVGEAAPAPAPREIDASFDETLRNTLLLAQRTADSTVKGATAEAERLKAEAAAEAATMLGAAREEADALVATAQTEHDSVTAAVAEERQRRLESVDAEVIERRNELQEALVANEGVARDQLIQEVSDLKQIRELLISDIDQFEDHLVTRREAVRVSLVSLNALVEADEAFAGLAAPQPSDVPEFDAEAFEAVAVELPADISADAVSETLTDDPQAPVVEGFVFGEGPDAEPAANPFDGADTQMYQVVITEEQPDVEPDAFAEFSEADIDESALLDIDPDDSPSLLEEFTDAQTISDERAVDELADASARPAWADAVPPEPRQEDAVAQPSGANDPFLDELRRATGDDAEASEGDDAEAEALNRFLDHSDDSSGRGGWFGRRK